MSDDGALVPYEAIESRILLIRGQKVMLDADLAALYGVPTKRLNEQVKRNQMRFPADFMFALTLQEAANLKSHIATSSWGGARHRPFPFTEHGALMAASVLNGPRAIEASVHVVRAFVRMRQAIETHREWAKKLDELEGKVGTHDEEIQLIFKALKRLMAEPEKKKKKPIGFAAKEAKGRYKK